MSRGGRPGIFISYRRDDSAADMAARVYERLSQRWPRRVFMDIDSIDGGELFAEAIEDTLQHCAVVLVMIGRDWLGTRDERGVPRMQKPGDYVRMEVATALGRKIKIVPVLSGNTPLPTRDDLPVDIAGLLDRQYVRVTRERFDADVQRLIAAVATEMPVEWWRAFRWRAIASALAVVVAFGAYLVVFRQYSAPTNSARESGVAPAPHVEVSGPDAPRRTASAQTTIPRNGSNNVGSVVANASDAEKRESSTVSTTGFAGVSGTWQTARLTDPWNAGYHYTISFEFVQRGDVLLGTVTEALPDVRAPSTKRIMEGIILEKKLLFYIEKQARLGEKLVSYKESYVGMLNETNDAIKFERSNDSPGAGDLEKFVATLIKAR
jgi:hypothetical protein